MEIRIFKPDEMREKAPPHISGLYYFFIDKEIVYVGRAKDVRSRLFGHWDNPWYQTQINTAVITNICVIEGLYDEEAKVIKNLKPRWNVNHNPGGFNEKNILCMDCGKRHDVEIECEERKNAWMNLARAMAKARR